MSIQQAIQAYIDKRHQEAIKKVKSEDELQTLRNRFQYDTWVSDAARRASQIQLGTHIAKFSHPDSKATSILSTGNTNAEGLLGTHQLENLSADASGNAGALDVYGLLSIEVNGQPLWELAAYEDPELVAAVGAENARRFAAVLGDQSKVDDFQKQIYWPTEQGDVLLNPLFPSTLAQSLYQRVQKDRFSEEAKASREARKSGHAGSPLTSYPNLAMLQVGGSKPQIVSAFNSQRKGQQYLLACLPPVEKPRRDVPISQSLWKHFSAFAQRELYALKWYLIANRGDLNFHKRQQRDDLARSVVSAFNRYRNHLSPLDWIHHPRCQLSSIERQTLLTGTYSEALGRTFGKFVNEQIHSRRRASVASEAYVWESLLKQGWK